MKNCSADGKVQNLFKRSQILCCEGCSKLITPNHKILWLYDWCRLESSTSQQNCQLVQAGGEDVITTICNKICQTWEWPTPWAQSLVITLPKKGSLQQFQNYQRISLISHPSKVMLKIMLNRLKPQAEKIIAEEQEGFRAGRSTTEQIFSLWILCEKYLQH